MSASLFTSVDGENDTAVFFLRRANMDSGERERTAQKKDSKTETVPHGGKCR